MRGHLWVLAFLGALLLAGCANRDRISGRKATASPAPASPAPVARSEGSPPAAPTAAAEGPASVAAVSGTAQGGAKPPATVSTTSPAASPGAPGDPAAAVAPLPTADGQLAGRPVPSAAPLTDNPKPPLEAFQKLLASLGVRVDLAKKRIEADGWVNMQRGLVEVFACAPDGKTHEAVVILDCVPSALNSALLAIDLKAGSPADLGNGEKPLSPGASGYRAPQGDKVYVYVRWKDETGKTHQARAEDWVWEKGAERPMRRVGWLYTGSFLQKVGGADGEESYAADYIKTLVSTYNDPTTIIDNPLLEGRDDTLFFANEKAVPAPRTPVTAIFSPTELPDE